MGRTKSPRSFGRTLMSSLSGCIEQSRVSVAVQLGPAPAERYCGLASGSRLRRTMMLQILEVAEDVELGQPSMLGCKDEPS